MKLFFTRSFEKDYERLPAVMQKHLDAQLMRLLQNPKHPSLNTKKIKGTDLKFMATPTSFVVLALMTFSKRRKLNPIWKPSPAYQS